MPRRLRWTMTVLGMLTFVSIGRAADAETRVFNLFVDGKRAGEATMAIAPQADGSMRVTCSTDVTVRVLLYTFRYNYRGTEVWKNGQLQQLASTCNDDGKRYTTNAERTGDSLRLTVNNRVRQVTGDVWLTSYWQLPDPKLRNDTLTLIDADNGREDRGRLQLVGQRTLTIAGQSHKLAHYRLTGRVAIDLWYDTSERLVRQEWLEDGHRTVLELASRER